MVKTCVYWTEPFTYIFADIDSKNKTFIILEKSLYICGKYKMNNQCLSVALISTTDVTTVAVTANTLAIGMFHVSELNGITLTRTIKTTAMYDST